MSSLASGRWMGSSSGLSTLASLGCIHGELCTSARDRAGRSAPGWPCPALLEVSSASLFPVGTQSPRADPGCLRHHPGGFVSHYNELSVPFIAAMLESEPIQGLSSSCPPSHCRSPQPLPTPCPSCCSAWALSVPLWTTTGWPPAWATRPCASSSSSSMAPPSTACS